MKILVKYPTRGRPVQFLARLREWAASAESPLSLHFLVTIDRDDATMTEEVQAKARAIHPSMTIIAGDSRTKIQACNADMASAPSDWEVLLLISDDMFCRRAGWDALVVSRMQAYYPDTDGCLWFHDGTKQRAISTLSCMGRKYYERFGYIYHPSYFSFFCDNEYTEVAMRDNKMVFIDTPIASHEHPAWNGGMKRDDIYIRNNRYWKVDEENYIRRKGYGFRQ